MIESVLTWMDGVNLEFDIHPKRVLDVGSKDRNGKIGARKQFPDSEYLGIDMEKGPNVDMIADVYQLEDYFPQGHFDAILSMHLLEHVAYFWKVLEQIKYVLSDHGYLYISAPGFGYPKHNYPSDYWRVTQEAMIEVLMQGYDVISIEDAKSTYHKHPIINCLGIKR